MSTHSIKASMPRGFRFWRCSRRLAAASGFQHEHGARVVYDQATELLARDVPRLILWHRRVFTGFSTRVQGFTPYPTESSASAASS